MNPYDILINIIKQTIEDEDLIALEINLMRLPFEKLNQTTCDQLLSKFINHCVEYANQKSIKTIFDVWYKMLSVDVGQLDHLTRLFTDITVSDEALLLVSITYTDENPIEYYMTKLIDYDSSPRTIIAAKRLDRLFETTYHTWSYLLEVSNETEIRKGYTNFLIEEFILNKLIEKGKTVDSPPWIINDYDYLPKNDSLVVDIKIPKASLDQLLIDLSDTDEEMEKIENHYRRLSKIDQKIYLDKYAKQKYRLSLNDDETLFKFYGPSNTEIFADLTGDDICSQYGCRMLTCNHMDAPYLDGEENDNFDVQISDWFTGSCEQCLKPIKYKHYACRKPLFNGSWMGCYCSWACVEDKLVFAEVERKLVNIYKEQLMTIGIQDRYY